MGETLISHPQQQQTNKNLYEYLFNIIYKLVPQRYTGQQCNRSIERKIYETIIRECPAQHNYMAGVSFEYSYYYNLSNSHRSQSDKPSTSV